MDKLFSDKGSMNKTRILPITLSLVLLLVSLPSLNIPIAHGATYTPGVSIGEWVDYGQLSFQGNGNSFNVLAFTHVIDLNSSVTNVNGNNVTVEIEIAASQYSIQVGAQRILITRKWRSQEFDPFVGLVGNGGCVSAIEGKDGLPIGIAAVDGCPIGYNEVRPVLATPVVSVVTEVHHRGRATNRNVGGDHRA